MAAHRYSFLTGRRFPFAGDTVEHSPTVERLTVGVQLGEVRKNQKHLRSVEPDLDTETFSQ